MKVECTPGALPACSFALIQVASYSAYLSVETARAPDLVEEQTQKPGVGVDVANNSVFTSPELGFVILGLWLIVPLLVAYRRFNVVDM